MRQKTNDLIRKRRTELGLPDSAVAQQVGLTIHEYGDVEQHEEELITTTPLRVVKNLSALLQIPLLELLPLQDSNEAPPAAAKESDRASLVRQRRLAVGLSEEELADQLGFDSSVVREIEEDHQYLDGWSFSLIHRLATILKLPVRSLVAG